MVDIKQIFSRARLAAECELATLVKVRMDLVYEDMNHRARVASLQQCAYTGLVLTITIS